MLQSIIPTVSCECSTNPITNVKSQDLTQERDWNRNTIEIKYK